MVTKAHPDFDRAVRLVCVCVCVPWICLTSQVPHHAGAFLCCAGKVGHCVNVPEGLHKYRYMISSTIISFLINPDAKSLLHFNDLIIREVSG